nr:hypothetical protein Itr_chr04CG17140 [Ipomoea trifida]
MKQPVRRQRKKLLTRQRTKEATKAARQRKNENSNHWRRWKTRGRSRLFAGKPSTPPPSRLAATPGAPPPSCSAVTPLATSTLGHHHPTPSFFMAPSGPPFSSSRWQRRQQQKNKNNQIVFFFRSRRCFPTNRDCRSGQLSDDRPRKTVTKNGNRESGNNSSSS